MLQLRLALSFCATSCSIVGLDAGCVGPKYTNSGTLLLNRCFCHHNFLPYRMTETFPVIIETLFHTERRSLTERTSRC
jgi:hypothetical protein